MVHCYIFKSLDTHYHIVDQNQISINEGKFIIFNNVESFQMLLPKSIFVQYWFISDKATYIYFLSFSVELIKTDSTEPVVTFKYAGISKNSVKMGILNPNLAKSLT